MCSEVQEKQARNTFAGKSLANISDSNLTGSNVVQAVDRFVTGCRGLDGVGDFAPRPFHTTGRAVCVY
jgi:hypothetical protein